MVGSIYAWPTDQNGNGAITGYIDQNGPNGTPEAAYQLLSGSSYSLPTGSNFGTMTLVSSLGTFQYDTVVSTSNDSKMILADPNHPAAWGSGLIKKQTLTVLSGGAANYSFGLFGNNTTGARYAAVGMFALATGQGSQAATGEQDINNAGTVTSQDLINSGTLTVTDPNLGRGTLTLNAGSGTYNYVFYIASANELVGVETDTGGPMTVIDIVQQQSAGISGGNLSVCKQSACQSVMGVDGATAGGAPVPVAANGVLSFDNNGNITRTDGLPAYYTDQNVGGTVSQVTYASGTYSVDATCGSITTPCGRVTVNLSGATTQPVWYLTAAGQAFVLGTDTDVEYGSMQSQTGFPFTAGSFLSSYLGATLTPVLPSVTNRVDVAVTPFPGGTLNGTYNGNGPGGIASQVAYIDNYDCGTPGQTTCSNYGTAFGRFETTNQADPNNGALSIYYVIGSGTSGTTGGKSGLVGISVGYVGTNNTTPAETNPQLTTFGR